MSVSCVIYGDIVCAYVNVCALGVWVHGHQHVGGGRKRHLEELGAGNDVLNCVNTRGDVRNGFARARAHTHKCTRAQITLTLADSLPHSLTHTHTHTLTHSLTCTHVHTHTHTHTPHVHSHTYQLTYTHTHTPEEAGLGAAGVADELTGDALL